MDEKDLSLEPPAIVTRLDGKFADAERRFQGIPGIERAPSGRLWATWYGGGSDEGPENFVLLATSGDGQAWSPPVLAIDPPGKVRAFDPCLWTDPLGRLWLFWAQSYEKWDGRGGVWAIVTENPSDPTPYWSMPRRICDGVMMNKPTVDRVGRWLLPVAMWGWKPPQASVTMPAGASVIVSEDDGQSFMRLGTAAVDPAVAEFEEHMIVERNDGSLWMLVRTKAYLGESVSTNSGRSWARVAPSTITHVNARFFIRRLLSGRLLLVKHTTPPGMTLQRSHLTAHLSSDDGRTWSTGLLIDERPNISYPDGIESPAGRIFVVYDFERLKDKQIWLATFSENDVMKGSGSSGHVLVNQASGGPNAEV